MVSTRVSQGTFQVVNVIYDKSGNSVTIPLSEWLPIRSGLKDNEIPSNAWLVSGTEYEHYFIAEKR